MTQRPDGRLVTKARLEKAREFYERRGPSTIVLGRFIPVIRTFAPVVAGAARMPYRTGDCTSAFRALPGHFDWCQGSRRCSASWLWSCGPGAQPVGLPHFPASRYLEVAARREDTPPSQRDARQQEFDAHLTLGGRDAADADHQAAPAGGRSLAPAAGAGTSTGPPRP